MSGKAISLGRYALRRALEAIPLVFGVIVFTFVLVHVTPGDPVYALTGAEASPEFISATREAYGLNLPIAQQLAIYLSKMLQGDFGYSFFFQQPVLGVIFAKLPATLLLMGTGLTLASLIGVMLGVISARKVYSAIDNTVTVLSLIGYSLPVMWFGQALVLILAVYLDLFPAGGMTSYSAVGLIETTLDLLWHMALPVVVIATFYIALICRMTRASLLEVLGKDYIVTARAKGLRENIVLYRHALRNAFPPVLAVLGVNVGMMFAGAILTETVFSWPGMGRFLYESVFRRDYPVLMGLFIFITASVVIANFVADVAHAYLDPRVRLR